MYYAFRLISCQQHLETLPCGLGETQAVTVSSLCLEFQVYTTHILSKSFGNMPGIYLDYSSACESSLACSSNAIGMPLLLQYTYFGCQGCLIISAKRGGTHVNARASADAALCGTASIVMSLLQQIPENIMITMMFT